MRNYRKQSQNKKIIAVIIGILVIMFILFLIQAGNILVINDTPIKADTIIVLAGDHKGDRTNFGVSLFKEGYSKNLVLTGGILYYKYTIAELMKRQALELGVPDKNIIVEAEAKNTWGNAIYSKKIMEREKFKSAIVVSSPYHMRRSKMLFNKVFKGSNIKLIYCSATDREYNPQKWWVNTFGIKTTVSEYIKLVYYGITK
jgi:uncharacterized SAM-binding protein YcdF (DUF218 family)